MSDNIKVVVKVRPLISREVEDKLSYRWRVKSNTLSQLDLNGRETDTCFTFDKVYDKDTKTLEVYNDIAKPIVEAAIAGFNGTIFAYGQTSSGKTYTMTGTEESPGIIQLAVLNLFENIKQKTDRDFLVRVSYIEIYNETLKDLLDVQKKNIKIHDTLQGVKVDCSEKVTGSPEEVLEVMKQGEVNRQTGATNMNEESSRSHSIFQITIESREHVDDEDEDSGSVNVSTLNLVDLAGSERAGQTGATGIRFKEGTHINKSLSVLALVIKQLSEDPNKYANYRDSKLTRILQNSLGGNAKTSIICAITPASVEESISTLQFANRAKCIKNKPEVNAVATNATMIQSLTKQLSKLQSELAAKRNLEVMLESSKNIEQELQTRIANLQKLILNGFGARSMQLGARRKAAAPRRVTISTLHHTEHEPAPPPPRFATPSLKYNPQCVSVPGAEPGAGRLAPVPEETRTVTPPPRDRPAIQDEIIEIDSDEDNTIEAPCSPYHKCYGSSKTPPCVLRKNAKMAEKNLKDIVELTEREKIYTPNVVELIEKIEYNVKQLEKLQEEIDVLKETSKEKDLKIEQLTDKVRNSETLFQAATSAKSYLEKQCKEKDTKFVDLEVSYETLLKKSKTREKELLLLLSEEQGSKKTEIIGLPNKMESEMLSFTDITKTVNSDNEDSSQDDGSSQLHELIAQLQIELTAKTQANEHLESEICNQKLQLESLNTSNQLLQHTIDDFKNKLNNMESEIIVLKSSIDFQKVKLECSERDINFYKNSIQELEIQLSNKEDILNMKVDDSMIESMIANEQIIIANNDNIKNIIHSLKVIIDSRKKEIESLKTIVGENSKISAENNTLTEQIKARDAHISSLIEEMEKLKTVLAENTATYNKLLKVEQELSSELRTMQKENAILQKENTESKIKIEELENILTENEIEMKNLQCENKTLKNRVADHEILENSMSTKYDEVLKQLEDLTSKNVSLQKDLNDKNIQNESLTRTLELKEISEQSKSTEIQTLLNQIHDMFQRISDLESFLQKNYTECHLTNAKNILYRLQNIVSKLKGDTEILPEYIEDSALALKISDTVVGNLDNSTEQTLATIADLENQIHIVTSLKDSQISAFKSEIEQLHNELTSQTDALSTKTFSLIEELKTIRADLKNKDQDIAELEEKLKNYESVTNKNDMKSKEILSKFNSVLCVLHNIALRLNQEIEDLPEPNDTFDGLFKAFDSKLKVLDNSVTQILKMVVDMQENLLEFTYKNKSEAENFESQIEEMNIDMSVQTLKLSQQILSFTELLKNSRTELEAKNLQLSRLEIELSDSQEHITNLRMDLESKDNRAASLQTQLDQLEEMFRENCAQINFLKDQLTDHAELVQDAIQNRDMLLEEIMSKTTRVGHKCGLDINEISKNNLGDVYNRIVLILDKISMSIDLIKTKNDVERSALEKKLQVSKEEALKLTETNISLLNNYGDLQERTNQQLLESELIKIPNTKLSRENLTLEQLNLEPQSKAKRQTFLSDFLNSSSFHASLHNLQKNFEHSSPQSLLTICCNKIIDVLQFQDANVSTNTSSITTTASKSSIQSENAHTQTRDCDCARLSLELSEANKSISKLMDDLETATTKNLEMVDLFNELSASNDFLLKEREEVKNEIKLLVEPAIELQKKITHHRTNLSTLTATTFAENKLLNSQLKVLKHHHTRYIHVCQRDLPAFKSQLNELMILLKDSSFAQTTIKRFSLPDVLDGSSSASTFKNESTLDGDLLMLDTNLTLATVDNTLVGPDQTCLDSTQVHFDANETICQANDTSKIIDPCLLYSQIETLSNDNQKLTEEVQRLLQENHNLKQQKSSIMTKATYKYTQNSPNKVNDTNEDISTAAVNGVCGYCVQLKRDLRNLEETLTSKYKECQEIKAEKDSIQEKYNNLSLETPSINALIKKLSNTEKDYIAKLQEINKLSNDLTSKSEFIKELQAENDTLSMQVMDNITEADTLKKELDALKDSNTELKERFRQLELLSKEYETNVKTENICSECGVKDNIIKSLQLEHSNLTRSLSDSESSSRYNKICTLQNELHASKEDCKKITEEFATIKNHLDRSNVSVCPAMDLDESMGDSSIFVISKEFDYPEKMSHNNINQAPDIYTKDKIDCLHFYIENIGSENQFTNGDVKIIDIMKAFYTDIVAKHSDDVENLLNKLRDFEESKTQLQTEFNSVISENSKLKFELGETQINLEALNEVLDNVKRNISLINQVMSNGLDNESNIVTLFKEKILGIFDAKLGLSCVDIFETVIETIFNKHQEDLSNVMGKYAELQDHMKMASTEFNEFNTNLKQIKCELSEKESEINLLKNQKEKIQEINHAVTLDLIKKEEELTELLSSTLKQLVEVDIIDPPCQIDTSLSLTERLRLLYKQLIMKTHNIKAKFIDEKENLVTEINDLNGIIGDKENVLKLLQEKLSENEMKLQTHKSLEDNLKIMCNEKVEENKRLHEEIENLKKEIKTIREKCITKENMSMEIDIMTEDGQVDPDNQEPNIPVKECDSCSNLLIKLECWAQDYDNLKTVNNVITKEKELISAELEKAQDIIAQNKAELDHMTSDILILRESVNENVHTIQTLTQKAKSLIDQNVQLKKQFDDKCLDCSRLEINIKTHEKTAEIQTKMITRLQKQKEEVDAAGKDKDKQLEELANKFLSMQKECEQMKKDLKTARDEVDSLMSRKDSLEAKVTDLEMDSVQDSHKRRQSIDKIAEVSRRRRQSLHDSVRVFTEDFDENKIETMFEARAKPDDLFAPVGPDASGRSTPARLSRGRDSLPPRPSPADDPPPRPASVADTRRRRQSIHDQHRPVHTPPPHPHDDTPDLRLTDAPQLRERLAATQRELEELQEKYRDLDEECETCAQYLQEREEQCRKLRKEKTALEHQVAELSDKLKFNPKRSEIRPSLCHAAVNTDEDWANLHSVVVDRMSFDAEVEKNKKLIRTIEELRCNKQELKNTIAKMQRALEKNAAFMHSKELDATKEELSSCKQALSELQQRYAELDEECETCAQYLRERDEQCRKLREAKHVLEMKLEQLQGEAGSPAAAARRKRHSAHDHNRAHVLAGEAERAPATDRFSNNEDCDNSTLKSGNELQQVKKTLETVLREKATLESQLAPAGPAPTLYVATGSAIVQNQQITDIMKENQKLKKMNAKLISICKKRGKIHDHDSNRENEQPSIEQH